MSKKKDDKKKLLTKVAKGVAFGDTSNSLVRNILTEVSKEIYGKINNDQMNETMDFFKWRCPYTGIDLKPLIENDLGGYATDHIYPQNQEWCGLNVQGNLVLVDKDANKAKGGLDIETFLFTDTKVLKDLDELGRTRQTRLDEIRRFQAEFHYDPERIRTVVRPILEERYTLVRTEQEACIRNVLKKLEKEGIKPLVTKASHSAMATIVCDNMGGKGYTYDEKIGVALYYLQHNEGLIQVEENHLKLVGRHGSTAKYILNKLGIDTRKHSKHKGLLNKVGVDIDSEIAKSEGAFRITLEELKKRGLI